MASNITRAQEIILCHLCDIDAKAAALLCNSCQVNLCEECVGKHYMTSSSSAHEIVKYKDRKFHLIFTNCESHKSEKCTVHCQNCDIPVCIKCLTGVHRGHEASDLSKIVESKKRQIIENTAHLENLIPQFDQADARIATSLADFISRCDELQIAVNKFGKEWHRIVDEIVDKNKKDIAKMKEDGIREIGDYQDENKNT
ncbi:E3 ubiquitin-protein ligase TRIM45-like, partial [Saccostrea cucullata]|uniref:E3 ubiquitin-protein ligase TRIM45-like n=1 Tax=Saccostrea cuccullata TaxID=36930 RepID=UPI002ED3C089